MFVRCRAKFHPECQDGKPEAEVYDEESMEDDGTYDRVSNTVVCTPCFLYIESATGIRPITNAELPSAIAAIRRQQEGGEHGGPGSTG